MTTADTYQAIAQAYVDGVRALFVPAGAVASERGGGGQLSPAELADRAERLVAVNANLTSVTAERLSDADAGVRIQSSSQLLAKTLVDLEISTHLLQAAIDEEEQVQWSASASRERSASGSAIEERLAIILDMSS